MTKFEIRTAYANLFNPFDYEDRLTESVQQKAIDVIKLFVEKVGYKTMREIPDSDRKSWRTLEKQYLKLEKAMQEPTNEKRFNALNKLLEELK